MKPTHDSIRGWFAAALFNEMKQNDKIWLVTADLGWGMWDSVQRVFPKRFLNTGASEQAAAGICVGLALEGYTPFFYSITSFLLYRAFEWHRNFLHHEGVPVRLIGSGLEDDYKHDGFSHHTFDAKEIIKQLWNIETYYPADKAEIPAIVRRMIERPKPAFLALRR